MIRYALMTLTAIAVITYQVISEAFYHYRLMMPWEWL